jgi:hypothetical protein
MMQTWADYLDGLQVDINNIASDHRINN